jgi:hypothetical protein
MTIDVKFKSASIDVQYTGKVEDLTSKILEIPIQSQRGKWRQIRTSTPLSIFIEFN